MVISRVFSDLDIIVTVSSVAFYIFLLISQIPVRHIDPTMRREECFHIVKHLDTLFESLEVVERGEKDDGIK
jgi:hypothetical protein